MSADAKRRQKAAEKRKQRELRVRKEMTERRVTRTSVVSQSRRVDVKELPLVECVISKGWEERGLAHILIARRLPEGHLMVAGYYIDTFCVGIKDTALIERIAEDEYRNNLRENVFNDPVELLDCDPSLARAVIEGSVEFAGRFGFKPNKRYEDSHIMLAGIELPATLPVFGKNGLPCYIDRAESNAKGVLARLERTAGPGKYLTEKGEKAA